MSEVVRHHKAAGGKQYLSVIGIAKSIFIILTVISLPIL